MTLETSEFIIFTIMFIIMAVISGAVIYRMRGGWPDWPRPLEQMLYCTIFLAMMLMAGVLFPVAIGAYSLAVVAVLTGHGQYFLNMAVLAIEPERLDFILKWFGFKADPRTNKVWAEYRDYSKITAAVVKQDLYETSITPDITEAMNDYGLDRLLNRNLAGLALTGGVVALAPAIALLFVNIPIALGFLILQTTAKPAAYYASHKLGYGTEGGEFGTGGAQWFIAAFTGVLLMVVS